VAGAAAADHRLARVEGGTLGTVEDILGAEHAREISVPPDRLFAAR
jgi:hypothetical protein